MGAKIQYNCNKCPAYCCCYPEIETTDRDIKRLAKHHGVSEKTARKKFTKKTEDGDRRCLRHRKDEHFGSSCMFLHPETRGCTIYEGRPTICREYPGVSKCAYYEFLKAERRAQEDPDLVVEVRF